MLSDMWMGSSVPGWAQSPAPRERKAEGDSLAYFSEAVQVPPLIHISPVCTEGLREPEAVTQFSCWCRGPKQAHS